VDDSSEIREHFIKYHWPGNVRELENVIEGAMNMVQDEHILKEEHFPEYFLRNDKRSSESIVSHLIQDKTDLKEVVEEIEKEYIVRTMEKHKGNITRAAEELGLKRQTLQHKLKKLNLDI